MEKIKSILSYSASSKFGAILLRSSAGILAIYSAWKLSKYIQRLILHQKLQKLIDQTRKHRQESIDKLQLHLEKILRNGDGDLETKWNSLARSSLLELQQMLQEGNTTAVEVLHAFQWNALRANRHVNCVTEFFMEAEGLALALDEKYGKSEDKPPFYGIPVSIKDNLQVKNHRSTAGMASYLTREIPSEEAALVGTLRSLGAVPFVHTNIPQTMMSMGCSNPIFGTTTNPVNGQRGPGGSSGGEGALIALYGSPLGIGSDIGGSIRIPAHYCGITGFKPGSTRVSRTGSAQVLLGILGVTGTWGPMSRDVDSLVIMMENIWRKNSPMFMDPVTVPLPFQHDLHDSKKSLTIGYYINDGNFEVVPACARALLEAKKALESRGHKLVPWSVPETEQKHIRGIPYNHGTLMMRVCNMDGGRFLKFMMDKDIMEPMNKDYFHFSMANTRAKEFFIYYITIIILNFHATSFLRVSSTFSPKNISDVLYERTRKDFTTLFQPCKFVMAEVWGLSQDRDPNLHIPSQTDLPRDCS